MIALQLSNRCNYFLMQFYPDYFPDFSKFEKSGDGKKAQMPTLGGVEELPNMESSVLQPTEFLNADFLANTGQVEVPHVQDGPTPFHLTNFTCLPFNNSS